MDETRTQPQRAPAPDPAATESHLDTLAEVTRAQALAAYSLFGLATVPAGLCLVAAAAAQWLERDLAAAAIAFAAPPLLLATAAFTHPRYQRHGRVAETGASAGTSNPTLPELLSRGGWFLLAIWAMSAVIDVTSLREVDGPGHLRLVRYLSLASVVAVGALLAWRRPRRGDASWIAVPLLGQDVTGHLSRVYVYATLGQPGDASVVEAFNPAARTPNYLLLTGLLLAGAGLGMHRWYRRLEARLAALRVSSPLPAEQEPAP